MKELKIFGSDILQFDKKQISDAANNVAKQIKDGNIDGIKTLIAVNKFSRLCKAIDSGIRKVAVTSIKIGEKETYEGYGCEINRAETGVKYDYSKCNDEVWDNLDAEIKRLTNEKKEREKFLRSIPDEGVANPETGEIIKKPVRTATDNFKITLK